MSGQGWRCWRHCETAPGDRAPKVPMHRQGRQRCPCVPFCVGMDRGVPCLGRDGQRCPLFGYKWTEVSPVSLVWVVRDVPVSLFWVRMDRDVPCLVRVDRGVPCLGTSRQRCPHVPFLGRDGQRCPQCPFFGWAGVSQFPFFWVGRGVPVPLSWPGVTRDVPSVPLHRQEHSNLFPAPPVCVGAGTEPHPAPPAPSTKG